MSRPIMVSCLLFTLCLIGCSQSTPERTFDFERVKAQTVQAPMDRNTAQRTEFIHSELPNPEQQPAKAGGEDAVRPIGADLPPERKIIFTGQLIVEVKDFADARQRLDDAVHNAKAYFSKTEIAGDSGSKRSGTFTVKVPVERFQLLVNELTTLGNPVKNQTDSQDVTEEYVDTQARVKNLKAEEDVLNLLLKEAGTRLDDVFKIREQIRKNRAEIERNEARVIALGKMAALSTLTVTLREIETYVAPVVPKPSDPIESPFTERAANAWTVSFGLLKRLGQNAALLCVALAPWLPVLAAGAVGIWGVRRYTGKRTITA